MAIKECFFWDDSPEAEASAIRIHTDIGSGVLGLVAAAELVESLPISMSLKAVVALAGAAAATIASDRFLFHAESDTGQQG